MGSYVSQSSQRGQTAMVTITVVSAITDEGSRSAVETFD